MKNLELLSGKELVDYLFSLDDEREMQEFERVEDELNWRYEPEYVSKLYREYKIKMGLIKDDTYDTYVDTYVDADGNEYPNVTQIPPMWDRGDNIIDLTDMPLD